MNQKNEGNTLPLFNEDGTRLYVYSAYEYEDSEFFVSSRKISQDEWEDIMDKIYTKYRTQLDVYEKANQELWDKRESGEISEEEYNKKDDLLTDSLYPCFPAVYEELQPMGFTPLEKYIQAKVFTPSFQSMTDYEEYLTRKSEK